MAFTFKPVTRRVRAGMKTLTARISLADARPRVRAGVFALLAALSLLMAVTQNPLVRQSENSVGKVVASALVVYASLRVINAALSAAQEININASAVVAGANLQPFKVLEPVDDMVERVADIIFAAAVGAMVATVGLEPVATLGALLLAAGLFVSALATLWPGIPARLHGLARYPIGRDGCPGAAAGYLPGAGIGETDDRRQGRGGTGHPERHRDAGEGGDRAGQRPGRRRRPRRRVLRAYCRGRRQG